MDIFKKHIEYLRDNPEGYWFKRKLYGWGWAPVRWQGWAVLAVFVACLIGAALNLSKDRASMTDAQIWQFVAEVAMLVAILIAICYKKGESPKWQWGLPKKVSK